MTISQEILEWLRNQPLTNDKGIMFTKGLYKLPTNLSETGRFIGFVKTFGNYYK
jgi:hypothetical protein